MNHQANDIEEFLQIEMIIRCNLNRYTRWRKKMCPLFDLLLLKNKEDILFK